MPVIDDLTTPLTTDQVRSAIYSVLAATGVTTTNWKPGAVVRTIITGVAIVASSLSGLISLLARSSFLALSSGDWLTLVALYGYGVTRVPATFATGFVTLTNTSGANYTLDPGDLILANPTTNKAYSNTSTFTLLAHTSLTVPVQAVELGSASTSFGGEISRVVSALSGVSCSNALAVAGTDAEQDVPLRSRCTAKLGALSPNGPRDAYDFVARSATRADSSNIGVSRTKVVRLPGGILDVYVASVSGAISGTVGDLSSDLGRVDDAMQRQSTPLGVTLNTFTVSTQAVDVTYEVWLYNTTSMAPADIATAIAKSLQALIQVQPIGGNVIPPDTGRIYISALEGAITAATDLSGARLPFFRALVTSPAGDLAVGASAVATLGAVTATAIHIVPGNGA